jgi:Alpha/beta hydrolase domain
MTPEADSMANMLRCRLPVVLIGFVLVCLPHLWAYGEVQRIEILSREPWLGGRPLGNVGTYEKVRGRAYFAVDPRHPANQRIADITLAPQNAQGQVEFSGDFVVLRPMEPSQARSTTLVEIPNRGVTQMNGFFFRVAAGSQFALPDPSPAGLDLPFPFDEGFTVAWMGWQFDVPAPGMALKVPSAPVNGVVRAVHIRGATEQGTTSFSLARPGFYCADEPLQADAVLTVQSHYDEAPRSVPRALWSFSRQEHGVSMPDACTVTLPQGFERGHIYQVMYRGVHPPIAGLGLAAVRDFVSYLKHGGVDSVLREHPETLQQVIGYGYSQSARFLRTFVYQGFNADERGRQAFDGLLVASAGAGRGSFNHRYAMPGQAGNSVLSVLRPVDLFPFTDDLESDVTTHSRGALLSLAQQSHTVPKIFYTYSSTEYWARVGSLATTTVDGLQDVPLGSSSRLYFIAGTPHAPGAFPPAHARPPSNQRYEYLMNYGSPIWAFHALLLTLDDWVAKGTPPPASAYPTLATRELVSRSAVQFPRIPGVEFPPYLPRNWRMDYGPDFATKGIISQEPPALGAPYTILVPQVDTNGNDIGGIRLPHVAVPLGTFTGWNYTVPRLANLDYLGGLVGSVIPFERTRADREASRDPRPSIAETYRTREVYLDRVRNAAEALVAQRFARREDIEAMLKDSARHWDFLMQPSPQ